VDFTLFSLTIAHFVQPVSAIGRDGGDRRFSPHRFAGVRAQTGQGRNRTLSGTADEMDKIILVWTIVASSG